MAEESSKGLLQRIIDKAGDKLGEKLADRLWDSLLTLGVGSILVTWVANEWPCIKQPVCKVAGWFLDALIAAAVVLAGAVAYLGRELLRERRERRALQVRQEAGRRSSERLIPTPQFDKIPVEDRRLNLRWFIRRPTGEWLHRRNIAATVSHVAVHGVLDGPFHAVPNCNAPLVEIEAWGLMAEMSPTSPTFDEKCSNCGERIFRGSNDPVWSVAQPHIAQVTVTGGDLQALAKQTHGTVGAALPAFDLDAEGIA